MVEIPNREQEAHVTGAENSSTTVAPNTHPMVTRSKSGALRTKPPFAGSVSTILEPTNVQQALRSAEWRRAMFQEFEALVRNNTWELVPYKGQQLVQCKWVYKIKLRANGTVERYKARLVAKGFQQDQG